MNGYNLFKKDPAPWRCLVMGSNRFHYCTEMNLKRTEVRNWIIKQDTECVTRENLKARHIK
jgi:hypothetical protein